MMRILVLLLATFFATTADAAVIFADGFESGDFSRWSYIQGQDPNHGPGAAYNYVTNASSAGIPPREGSKVARFERPASATSRPHAKIYKEWSNVGKRDQFGRTEERLPNGGDPSAIYSASFFFPSNYSVPADWVNVFQFKEEGYIDGDWHQDPSWWLNVASAASMGVGSGRDPVIFANRWKQNYSTFRPKTMPVPRGRWFEIRAHLYEGDRIEWYVDGKLLDVSYDSVYPVGRFFEQSNGWIFGVGHYGGLGALFVDDAKVQTLGSTNPSPTPAPTPTPVSGSVEIVVVGNPATGSYSIEAKTTIAGDIRVEFYDNGVRHNVEVNFPYCMTSEERGACVAGTLGPGVHNLEARVFSESGSAVLARATRTITESAPTADITPPNVQLNTPSSTTIARGSQVSVAATASDNVGVARVDFYVNDVLVTSDASTPFAGSFRVSPIAGKTYRVEAIAYDQAGNLRTSSPLTLTSN